MNRFHVTTRLKVKAKIEEHSERKKAEKVGRLKERIKVLDQKCKGIEKEVGKVCEALSRIAREKIASIQREKNIMKLQYFNYNKKVKRNNLFCKHPNSFECIANNELFKEITEKFELFLTTFKVNLIKTAPIESNKSKFTDLHSLSLLKGHCSPIVSLSLSPDHNFLLSGSQDSSIGIWDLHFPAKSFKIRCKFQISSISFNSQATQFVAGFNNGLVSIWEYPIYKKIKSLKIHSSKVTATSYSLNGSYLLTGSYDKTVKLCAIHHNHEVFLLGTHNEPVLDVKAFNLLYGASSSIDKTIVIWDFTLKAATNILKSHSAAVNSIAFSSDFEKLVSVSYDKTIKVWEMGSLECKTVILEACAVCVTFLHKDELIAFSDSELKIIIYNIDTLNIEKILKGHSDKINSLCYSSNFHCIFSASGHFCNSLDNSIRIWPLDSSESSIKIQGITIKVIFAIVSCNEHYVIAGCNDNNVWVWDLLNKNLNFKMKGHTNWVTCGTCTFDSKFVVTGSMDETIILWDLELQAKIYRFIGHNSPIRCLKIAWSNTFFVSGCTGGQVIIWNLCKKSEFVLFKAHSNEICSLTITNDNNFVISFSTDKTLKVLNIKNHSIDQQYDISETPMSFFQLALSQKLMIYASYSFIFIRSLHHKRLIKKLQGHSQQINGLSISKSEKYLISSSSDRKILIWSLKTLKCLSAITEKFCEVSQETLYIQSSLFLYSFHNTVRLRKLKLEVLKQKLQKHNVIFSDFPSIQDFSVT